MASSRANHENSAAIMVYCFIFIFNVFWDVMGGCWGGLFVWLVCF